MKTLIFVLAMSPLTSFAQPSVEGLSRLQVSMARWERAVLPSLGEMENKNLECLGVAQSDEREFYFVKDIESVRDQDGNLFRSGSRSLFDDSSVATNHEFGARISRHWEIRREASGAYLIASVQRVISLEPVAEQTSGAPDGIPYAPHAPSTVIPTQSHVGELYVCETR